MAQVIRSPRQYDVCIIGSGAGGGMAAKILTEGGLNCALLEAGPNVNPEKDFKMLMWPYEAPHRGAGVGGHARENFGEFLAPNGAWKIEGEPRSEEHTSELQSQSNLVCRLLLEKKTISSVTSHSLQWETDHFRSYCRTRTVYMIL